MLKNWNRILNYSIVIHNLLRININTFGYVKSINLLSIGLNSILSAIDTFHPLSIKEIKKIIKFIIDKDASNELVTSCISISLFVHILCLISKINSKIIIGVALINNKVFSHAWVETDFEKIDFMSEGYAYKVIKEISIV